MSLQIKLMRMRAEARPPVYATPGSAGFDVAAAINQPLCLKAGERILVPTGWAFGIAEGYEVQIRPRSGLALKHGITVPNAPGTIDSDYRGEVQVILSNLSSEAFEISPGMRIAQCVLAEVVQAEFIEVESQVELGDTQRGTGGFGSTGR